MNYLEARTLGLQFYNTGKPCKRGHLSNRYSTTGKCVECCKSVYSKKPISNTEEKIIVGDKNENIISREDAKNWGLYKYFTGIPCRNGHISQRLTYNGQCVSCKNRITKTSRDKYKERDKEKEKLRHAEYKEQNREEVLKRRRDYYARNTNREKSKHKEWRDNNKWRLYLSRKVKEQRLYDRVPAWVNKPLIKEIYDRCFELTRSTGISYSVDHIVPLLGDNVSGLHTHHNLRIIPLVDNCRKRHKWNPDEPYIFSYHEELELYDSINQTI